VPQFNIRSPVSCKSSPIPKKKLLIDTLFIYYKNKVNRRMVLKQSLCAKTFVYRKKAVL